MNKLYYLVCEEKDKTLFEGRCLARTRGAAMKHMKAQLGRSNLTGLVFSITEIPVPLIRELVKAIIGNRPLEEVTIAGGDAVTNAEPKPEKPTRFDAFQRPTVVPDHEEEPDTSMGEVKDTPPPKFNRKPRPDPQYPWEKIKAYYMKTGSPTQTAEKFKVKLVTVQGRVKREGWAKERLAS